MSYFIYTGLLFSNHFSRLYIVSIFVPFKMSKITEYWQRQRYVEKHGDTSEHDLFWESQLIKYNWLRQAQAKTGINDRSPQSWIS